MDFSSPAAPAVAAVIPERGEVSCLSYHEEGRRLFAVCQDSSRLQIIDCLGGKVLQPSLRCETEKISCVEATHHEDCVLIAGKGSPTQPQSARCAISYWSIHDNKILRKFRGHSGQVTSISMCPADDKFLSSSLDGTVRLWTSQSAGCLAEMKLPADKTSGAPIAAFDSTGLVFAVSASMSDDQGHYVHLYDARNFKDGAFAELKVLREDLEKSIQAYMRVAPDQATTLALADWTSIDFNVSGNQILVGSHLGTSFILDGFDGTIKGVYSGDFQNRPAVSCVTSDDRSLLLGNEDGSIQCYDLITGSMIKRMEGHPGRVTCIAANPKYSQFASSSQQTALWGW